ncbi:MULTISPECIES: hypothetical protein [Bacillus]|uniref:hypothetical protein n=1 Tax=Bacillus TaxID=1386 RepID=UPI00032F72D2|nr:MULTISPECIES: hypothetical protein [Bacillus cereus group]EOP52952.1 hypothetical protein IIW_02126 [Bacillus cereus VD136]EOP68584.1 hypothetical protein KOW_03793 [Bacillus cereus VDM006]EOQ05236.1 hypothetical protein KOY_03022 [Bacillus cereus VDM021]MDF2086424.1 hypothetical protein [Bacillus pseudomycoides]
MKFYYDGSGNKIKFHFEMNKPKPKSEKNTGKEIFSSVYLIVQILYMLQRFFQ